MRKNIIKKAVATTSLAMAMAFGFNAVAASAATVKFFIQNDGAEVNDTTTKTDTVSQPTNQFSAVVFETELNRTKADGNVNEFNGKKYVNNGDVERTLGEDIMAALSEKVERGTVDWYVLKEESDGWHVDGIKLETPNKTENNGHKGDNGPAHDANGKADNVQPASTPAAIVVPATPITPAAIVVPATPSTPAAIVVPATPSTPAAIEAQNPSTESEEGTKTETETEKEDVANNNDTQNDQGDSNNNNENNGNNSENNAPAYIVPIIYEYVPVVVEPEAEEVIELEEVETPEGAVEEVAEEVVEEAEEIEIEEVETPEGAVEEVEEVTEEVEEEEVVEEVETVEEVEEVEEEEIEIEDLETPEGDVLPQTGLASAMVLYGLGALCVAAGATVAFKAGRKEEE